MRLADEFFAGVTLDLTELIIDVDDHPFGIRDRQDRMTVSRMA